MRVTTPSGASYPIKDKKSQTYYDDMRDRYMAKYRFTDEADLDGLHELIMCHVAIFELTESISKEQNKRDAQPGLGLKVHESIRDYKKEVRSLQDTLNISAKSRNRDKEATDIGDWMAKTLKRAKLFKHSRDMQAKKAREIINKTKAMFRMIEVCNEEEKTVTGIRSEADMIARLKEWIKEYDAIDVPMKKEQESWGVGDDVV